MDSFCVLPFVQFNNESDGTTKPCCENVVGFGNSRVDGILGAWNSDAWRALRRSFAAGERAAACRHCWELEDRGIPSPRAQNNAWHGSLLDVAGSYDPETGAMRIPPRNVVLKHSNLCNLACRMCTPENSTSLARVWDAELTEITGKASQGVVRNYPDLPRFWEELRSIAPTLNQVSFSGGEPFADPVVLDTLVALQPWAHQVQVYMNTSLSKLRYGKIETLALLARFDRRMLCLSVDGPPALHAYIRPGLDAGEFVENVAALKRARFGAVHVNVAVQLLNALRLPETLDFVLGVVQPELVMMTIVAGGDHLDPRILPVPLKRQLSADYEAYRQTMSPALYPHAPAHVLQEARDILDKVERYTWSEDLCDDARWARASRFYGALDRAHGTEIREACPELAAALP